MLAGHQDLAQDLAHAHVAFEAHGAGAAEGAGHGAAHLRGEALGPAAHAFAGVAGDEHGLHFGAVLEAEQELGGIVAALFHGDDLGPADLGALGQTFPAGFGDIGHGVEIAGHLLPDPLPDLDGPELGLAQLVLHPVGEFGQGIVEEVDHGLRGCHGRARPWVGGTGRAAGRRGPVPGARAACRTCRRGNTRGRGRRQDAVLPLPGWSCRGGPFAGGRRRTRERV